MDFLKLQVGEANKVPKLDMVHVIRLPSFEGWWRTKVIGRYGVHFAWLCGYGDEEPMRNPNTLTITASVYRGSIRVTHKVAMLHGVNTLLVRNNVNCCITAGKLRDELVNG